METNQDYSEVLSDFQAIFKECLLKVEEQGFNNQFEENIVGLFLINSWLGALLRMESNNPLEGFKDFIIQQLSN
ncbi:hypothetical protein [Seonamhaeicola sp.]|uniref:hypothetical protein n=1 Tax=Seonamhaeicola sp. TaxID=1912245 RepID=UPI002606C123|nr:hypothetical protein [Seonamhaeicola sp.]